MEPGAVIEGLDIVEDGAARLGVSGEALLIDQFLFEAAPERLDKGVIVAVTFATHGGHEPVLGEELAVGRAGELAPTIGVEEEWLARTTLA